MEEVHGESLVASRLPTLSESRATRTLPPNGVPGSGVALGRIARPTCGFVGTDGLSRTLWERYGGDMGK